MSDKPTVVSLFSGAGGMDLGFLQAGFEVIWANDFDKNAVNTYKKNIGDHIILGDITKIDSESIAGEIGNVDVVIGGFPCQGFSISNTKRTMEDERNFLYLELLRVIRDKQPKFFIAENVKGLLSMQKGQVMEMILEDLRSIGYTVDYKLINTADYGIPQARERVFIVGNRLGIDNQFPDRTHTRDKSDVTLIPHKTVEETIGFLSNVEIQNGKVNESIVVDGDEIHNHIASTRVKDKFYARKHPIEQSEVCDYLRKFRKQAGLSVREIDTLFGYKHTAAHWFRKDSSGSIPKPNDWWKLKEILNLDDTYDETITTFVEKEINFEQSLRITNWDRASATITATTPEIHINKERRLSVRECAMLQTFPNDFIFTGSLSAMYRQVGNAVPVEMANILAKQVLENIKSFSKPTPVKVCR